MPSSAVGTLVAAAAVAVTVVAAASSSLSSSSSSSTSPSPTASEAPTPTSAFSSKPPDPSSTTAPAAEEQERYSSLAFCLVLALLTGSFWTSYYLKRKRITAVHETIVGLLAGMFVGACLRIGPGEQVQHMLSFSNTIMLNVLLPPIILASGYDLKQERFFRNFWVILTFALAGTLISAIIIGVIVWLWSLLRLESIHLNLLDCLIFGSTLSATDPVTILAIFKSYKVDPELDSIIFGESILNDAVSIVMFDTLSTFRNKDIYISSVFHGIGLFLVVFTFSMILGVAFGLACSLMLKHSKLSHYPGLESCLVLLIAYMSYFFSNSVTMSENFIFIYLGLSIFTQEVLRYKPLFILVTIFAVLASRYSAVFPLAALVNAIKRFRNRRIQARSAGSVRNRNRLMSPEIPREYQIMLFWAGLRGAVGFALSAGIEGSNAIALQTTVLVTVVITVLIFGGTTAQMLEVLKIRTGVQDDEDDSTDDEDGHGFGDDDGAFGPDDADLRLQSTGRRRNYDSRSRGDDKWKNGGRDAEWNSSSGMGSRNLRRQARSSRYGNKDSGPEEDGDALLDDDLDTRSSLSSEVLPPHTSARVFGGSGSGSGPSGRMSGYYSPTGIEPPATPPPQAPMPPLSSNPAASSSSPMARQLLDRAGLIMRDGQWFQKIDERYLLPMFSNSVASRKAEERKSARMRAAAAVGSGSGPGSGGGVVGGGGAGTSSGHASPGGTRSGSETDPSSRRGSLMTSAGLAGGAGIVDESAEWGNVARGSMEAQRVLEPDAHVVDAPDDD
ncbi:monovalent cation:H+ antiporter, CPA1 (nhx1) [Tilletia horrida]|uniref:Monovalent cation:H+ antiporter, CPA1 (Nhx1) n=1 Tax=Tilletia horrida TaxID=155126 RepID=A0AAN6GHN2_9BASI|nr:monovalent cation:H+ antiporter, CPA1 (nhx1) [Tilletia horrida]